MWPEWILKILESMGVAGAIIFVLMAVVAALVAYIRSLLARDQKIYGYRLQERDTLSKALTDSSEVLKDMLKVTEERNELTEEQAKLIERQSLAFELLKVTMLAQYEAIRDHNGNMSQVIGAMAEAIRALTNITMENRGIAMENRTIALGQVQSVQRSIDELGSKFREALATSSQSHTAEMRRLLGDSTVVKRRRS